MAASFFEQELSRALREQAFGIAAYRIVRHSRTDAVAVVQLLENQEIVVSLTGRGYQASSGPIHETVENLLASVSQLYQRRRNEVLMARLSALGRR